MFQKELKKYRYNNLDSNQDKKFIEFLIHLRTRVNSFVKNTSSVYYKVFAEKLYISANQSVIDTESGENIASFENNSSLIINIKII